MQLSMVTLRLIHNAVHNIHVRFIVSRISILIPQAVTTSNDFHSKLTVHTYGNHACKWPGYHGTWPKRCDSLIVHVYPIGTEYGDIKCQNSLARTL